MHSPPSSPLSLFVCFSSISTSDPSLLFYPQVGNTHPHRPEFLFVLLACICSCLGGKSDQPRLDQLAAFKLGIKELGAPSLCSHSSFYLRALSLGEAMGTVFYIIKASFLIWLVMLEYSICWTEHTRASGSVAPWTSLEVYNLDISKFSLPWLVWSIKAWACMFISPVEIPFSFYNNPKRQCYLLFPFFQIRKLNLREVKQLAQSHTASTMWK